MYVCLYGFAYFVVLLPVCGPARIYSVGPTTDDDDGDDFSLPPLHDSVEKQANSVLPSNAAGLRRAKWDEDKMAVGR